MGCSQIWQFMHNTVNKGFVFKTLITLSLSREYTYIDRSHYCIFRGHAISAWLVFIDVQKKSYFVNKPIKTRLDELYRLPGEVF